MLLKRLELAGFKSFAKKTEFAFDSSVTAVVGPNGSGKSNVAESLRWVLGEQSLTSIRGRRGEDFIFTGSPSLPRQNVASVTVVFNNTGRQFSIDYDEVAITREVHRDGENIYRLNGSKVRLKDIIELLSAVSLGVSQHHVVSQGDADRLLSANILERREMVEDALGIKIYEYKRNEAKKKLKATEVHAKEVEGLRRELAPHIKFLEKQVEQIRKADVIKENLREEARIYLATEEAYIKTKRSELNISKKELNKKKEEILGEIRELGKIREDEIGKSLREELSKIEKELYEIRGRLNEETRSLGKEEGALGSKCEEKKRLESKQENNNRNENATVPLSSVAAFVGEIEGEIEASSLSNDIESLKRSLSRLKGTIAAFLARCRGGVVVNNDDSKARIAREIEDLERKISSSKKLLSTLELERDDSELRAVGLRAELEARAAKSRDAERVHYELEAKKSTIENELRMVFLESDKLISIENDWKREQTEVAILVGGVVLDLSIAPVSAEQISDRNAQDSRRKKVERLKIRLEEMGIGGEDVVREYEETKERDAFLVRELEDLRATAEKLDKLADDLGKQIDNEFKLGVEKINLSFTKYFEQLFGGGNAKLNIVLSQKRRVSKENELEQELLGGELIQEEEIREGLDITVSIPRKRVKSLEVLSGGERTLVSIALLFALTAVKPPPFLVLDETDAALDEMNSRKYGEMLEILAGHTQLILITHNRETMSHAGSLYGVTLGPDGMSRILSVKFEEASQMAAR